MRRLARDYLNFSPAGVADMSSCSPDQLSSGRQYFHDESPHDEPPRDESPEEQFPRSPPNSVLVSAFLGVFPSSSFGHHSYCNGKVSHTG